MQRILKCYILRNQEGGNNLENLCNCKNTALVYIYIALHVILKK